MEPIIHVDCHIEVLAQFAERLYMMVEIGLVLASQWTSLYLLRDLCYYRCPKDLISFLLTSSLVPRSMLCFRSRKRLIPSRIAPVVS